MKTLESTNTPAGAALSADDVRAIVRIVHEVHDEHVPLSVRLGVLTRQLCVLTRARRCHIGMVDSSRGVWPLDLSVCAEFGWMDGSDVRLMMSALRDDRAVDEMAMRMVREEPNGAGGSGVLTRTAIGLLGEEGWRRNVLYDYYLRPVGVDDVIQSRLAGAMGAHRHGWVALVRDRSDGVFLERDAMVVDALHAEIGPWLWGRIASELLRSDGGGERAIDARNGRRTAADLLALLSPMQRRVLPFLLKGCTEDEIALEINRSKHTVHDHAKRIYDAVAVKSRIDLVIMFQNAGWNERMLDASANGGGGVRDGGR